VRFGALRRPGRTSAEIGLHPAAELLTAGWRLAGGITILLTGAQADACAVAGPGR
jgi:hypothetical protein